MAIQRSTSKDIKAISRDLVIVAGVISIHSDASVLSHTIAGASVAKSGTGEYTVTLSSKVASLLSAQVSMEAATAVDLVAQVKSSDVASAKTVVINLNAVATPTNPSAVCKIHVFLVLKNSSIV